MLVPHVKTTTMLESPVVEVDRITSTPEFPLRALSIGKVISSSTSCAGSPGASVWMATWGGANSGNTSRVVRRTATRPPISSTTEATTTRMRLLSDHWMIQANIVVPFLIGLTREYQAATSGRKPLGVQLAVAVRHDSIARREAP